MHHLMESENSTTMLPGDTFFTTYNWSVQHGYKGEYLNGNIDEIRIWDI